MKINAPAYSDELIPLVKAAGFNPNRVTAVNVSRNLKVLKGVWLWNGRLDKPAYKYISL